jgi:hypothetical protein
MSGILVFVSVFVFLISSYYFPLSELWFVRDIQTILFSVFLTWRGWKKNG